MEEFLIELNRYNLCTWYMLPLIGLNMQAFGEKNFVDSYLVQGRRQIVAGVLDLEVCKSLAQHPNFRMSVYRGAKSTQLLLFDMPEEWKADYEQFLKGKYSKMSNKAKKLIRKLSGLTYEVKNERGDTITSAMLMALDKHPSLRNKWLEILGSDTALPEELLSIPGNRCFIAMEEL